MQSLPGNPGNRREMSTFQFILWTCITLIPRADKDERKLRTNISQEYRNRHRTPSPSVNYHYSLPISYSTPLCKECKLCISLESVQGERFRSISFRNESRLSVLHCLVAGPCKGGWPMPTISLSTWTYQSPLLHSTFSVSISLTLLGTAQPLEVSRSKHKFNLQIKWNH